MVLKFFKIFLISITVLMGISFVIFDPISQDVNAEHDTVTESLETGINTVSLRDVTQTRNNTTTIDIDPKTLRPGDTVTINVNDDAANLRPDEKDSIAAFANSTTSNPIIMTPILMETEINSGNFTGQITLSSDTSTSSNLQVGSGDSISFGYDPNDPPESSRFQAIITSDGPGTIELTDFFIDDSTKATAACPFEAVTHPVEVKIIGTTASNIEVTISYANSVGVDNFLNTPNFLKIGYRPSSGAAFSSLTPNGDTSGHDYSAKTVTSILQPSNVNGQYVLGFETGCPGGGGGGLVRPSLVVNALAGVGSLGGGGSAYSSPTLQLSNLVQLGIIDVPLEVEQMVLNHDSTIPVPAMEPGYFEEDFDYPLIINDKGFVLTGYSTTIETQTLEINTPHTIKFMYYESEGIQHFSLYTNLRDDYTEIHQSDTQILYNDGQELEIIDPNGFFGNVTFTLNEIDDIKKEIVLELTFAKPMDTSNIVLRAWDPFLNSFDTHILDAITVVPDEVIESPTPTFDEPVIEELKSQTIPIWVKNNAAWWSDEQISDGDFVAGVEYLITNGIIVVPGVQVGTNPTSEIPDWIKNNAGWWADSLITDSDFIESMQWLIENGVVQI